MKEVGYLHYCVLMTILERCTCHRVFVGRPFLFLFSFVVLPIVSKKNLNVDILDTIRNVLNENTCIVEASAVAVKLNCRR